MIPIRTSRAVPLFCAAVVACKSAGSGNAETTAAVGATTAARGVASKGSDTTRTGSTTQAIPGGDVLLTLDRTSYVAGDAATMRIVNTGRDTLGYNQCSSRVVERQEGSRWVPHVEPGRMCTMELRLLSPNETQTATTDLPATLAKGTYRIVLSLTVQRTPSTGETMPRVVRAVSPAFRVD